MREERRIALCIVCHVLGVDEGEHAVVHGGGGGWSCVDEGV